MKGAFLGLENPDAAPPRYRLNMSVAPLMWHAQAYQMLIHPNPSYWNSLWLGVGVNFLNFPLRLYEEVYLMSRRVSLWLGLTMILFVPATALWHLFAGLAGQLHAVDAPMDVLSSLRDSTPDEVRTDHVLGLSAVIRHAL